MRARLRNWVKAWIPSKVGVVSADSIETLLLRMQALNWT